MTFGFALGFALLAFFWLISNYGSSGEVKDFVGKIDLGYAFLYGFVAGTIISTIYNFVVLRRLNLFGLESSID